MDENTVIPYRPMPSRFQSTSFSIAGSESAAVLTYVLANLTPEELHKQLSGATTKLIPSQIEKLLIALQGAGVLTSAAQNAVADPTRRHCARCHQAYVEKQNGLEACVILHCKPDVREREGEGRKVEYWYPCCGLKALVLVSGKEHPCFKGRHTTLSENVRYALNVWTCERVMCAEARPGA